MSDSTPSPADEVLRAKLNMETSTIAWQDLQRHFAAGRVIQVARGLDLVEVAMQLSLDNKTACSAWLNSGQVSAVDATQAQRWFEGNAQLWAVVVAPWVLVQEPQVEPTSA